MNIRLTKFLAASNYSSLEEYIDTIKKDVNTYFLQLPISELESDEILRRLNQFLSWCDKIDKLRLAGFSVDTQVMSLGDIRIDIKEN